MKKQKSKFSKIKKSVIFKDLAQQINLSNEEQKQTQNHSQTSKEEKSSECFDKYSEKSFNSPQMIQSEEKILKNDIFTDQPVESQIISFQENSLEKQPAKHLTGCQLFCNKFSALISMLILFTIVILLYYTFLFLHINLLISNSIVGPNIQFWIKNLWEDQIYARAAKEFIFLHIILGIFLLALVKAAFISPGLIPQELKGPQLLSSEIKKLEELNRFADYSQQIRKWSLFSQENLSDKIDVEKKFEKQNISLNFNNQGQQGENIEKYQLYEEELNQTLDENQSFLNKEKKKKNSQLVFQFFKQSIEYKTKKKFWGMPRYCKQCSAYKPDRSHHCSICNKCVLKMDHHCPFVNNCIGFYNYKYFVLILIYSDIMLIFFSITFVESLLQTVYDKQNSAFVTGLFVTVYCFVNLMGLIITGFLLVHFYMIFNGLTTIEYREKMQRNYKLSPYNISYYYNFCVVFGTNPIFWLMPFNTNKQGDGLKFKSTRKHHF